MLVCIAGTDGCGKSTLVESLQVELSQSYTCKQIHLYDTVIYPKLQKRAAMFLKRNGIENTHYNLVIAYLMYELEEKAFPQINCLIQNNEIVILDRYLETIDFIVENYYVDKRILNAILNKFQKPDIYIYIKASPNVSYKRITALRTPGEGEELHEIVAANNYYDSHIQTYGFIVVDGEQSKEEVLKNCLSIIQTEYHKMLSKTIGSGCSG